MTLLSSEEFAVTFDTTMPKLEPVVARKVVQHANQKVQEFISSSSSSSSLFALSTQQQHHRQHKLLQENEDIKQIFHHDLKLGRMIGSGKFSSLFKIKRSNVPDILSNEQCKSCVVKLLQPNLMNRPGLMASCVADLYKEATILSLLKPHDNVVQIHAITPTGINAFASGYFDSFFIVLDRFDKTLTEQIQEWQQQERNNFDNHGSRPPQKRALIKKSLYSQRLQLGVQLANAVKHIHKNCIMHRDIKPENIALDKAGTNLKIFDFDSARIVPACDKDAAFLYTQNIGTKRYLAGEVALGRPYDMSIDTYSTSCVLYYMLTLKQPYEEFTCEDMKTLVYERGLRPDLATHQCDSMSFEMKLMLSSGWSSIATERPTMEVMHQMLQQEYEVLSSEHNIIIPKVVTATKQQSDSLTEKTTRKGKSKQSSSIRRTLSRLVRGPSKRSTNSPTQKSIDMDGSLSESTQED